MAFQIHYFKKLDSTMNKAKEFSAGNIIVSVEQTSGRGRFKRLWDSGKGGVYFSIILSAKINNAKYLTIKAAVITQHVLKKLYNLDSEIKWPNDLIVKEKKLSGILTENYVERGDIKMIVGIGINVNNTVPSIGISLKKLGIKADEMEIIKELAKQFEKDYSKDYILKEWRKLSHTLGKKVKVKTKNGEIIGVAEDIDKNYNLIIKTATGKIESILEGDVIIMYSEL